MSGARHIPLSNTDLVSAFQEPVCPDGGNTVLIVSCLLWIHIYFLFRCGTSPLDEDPQSFITKYKYLQSKLAVFHQHSAPATSYSFLKCSDSHLFMLPSDHVSLLYVFLTLCQLQSHLGTPQPGQP